MAFDPDAYLRSKESSVGGFDPDAYLASRSPSQSLSDLPIDNGKIKETIPGEKSRPKGRVVPVEGAHGRIIGFKEIHDDNSDSTGLESFGNSVSLGYLPQMQAMAEKYLMPNPTQGVDDSLRAQGFNVPNEDSYVQMRDQNIQRQLTQSQENPVDSAIGTIGGALVTAPILGAAGKAAGLAKATGFGGRVFQAGATGAAVGAVSNPGDTEGEVNPIQLSERAQESVKGAAIGGIAQVGGESIAKTGEAIKNSPKFFDKVGNITAVKAIGALPRDLKKLFAKNNALDIGDTILKKNLIGDTIEETAKNAAIAKKETGNKIGEIYQKAMEEVTPEKLAKMPVKARKLLERTELNGEEMAETALIKIEKNLKNDIVDPEIKNKVLDSLKQLQDKGKQIDIKDLNEVKSNLDKKINYDRSIPSDLQKQLKVIRDVVSKRIQDRVRVLGKITGEGDLITQLKTANKEYGHLSKAESIASNRAKEIEGHKFLSLTDTITGSGAGVIGAMTGDSPEEKVKNALLGFAIGSAGNKAVKHLTPAAARSAKRLGVLLKQPANFAKFGSPLIEAAKKSPQEFQSFIQTISNDPDFKKLSTSK